MRPRRRSHDVLLMGVTGSRVLDDVSPVGFIASCVLDPIGICADIVVGTEMPCSGRPSVEDE